MGSKSDILHSDKKQEFLKQHWYGLFLDRFDCSEVKMCIK